MSFTHFSTESALTVKAWNNRAYMDFVTGKNILSNMKKIGVVSSQDQLSNNPGDTVTVSFLKKQNGRGLVGDESATGCEHALPYFADAVKINEIRYPISIPGTNTISRQRVGFDMPEDLYKSSMDWLAERATLSVYNQLAGFNPNSMSWAGKIYTGADRLQLQGLNAVTAPSTNRKFLPNGHTTEAQVAADTTATAKLSDINQLEYIAETMQPYIRPLSETGAIKFEYHVHTSIFNQLLNDTSAPIQFRDLYTSMITSGRGEGAISRSFEYSQTRVICSDKLPNGIDSSGDVLPNVRRSVFVGRDACVLALGQGFNDGKGIVPGFVIKSESYDIGKWERIAISAIWGIKKTVFDGIDHGVIVSSNYTNQTYQS